VNGCADCGGGGGDRHPAVPNVLYSNEHLDPVLGPYLGGGVVGTGLGAGNIAKVGGGLEPFAVHLHASPDPGLPYPAVRHDFHYDYSTPTMIFQRDRFIDAPLDRELGGIRGGMIGQL
jgi:hypothetical protein